MWHTAQMSGLRAKQKADRHTRILETATTLFRENGYDAVKMEAIAAAAEVSIGTIYNYYQNKGDLLVAIVAMEVNEVLSAGEKVIAKPPKTAAKAIDMLIGNYIEHSLVYLSKEMWREAMAMSIRQPDSPFGLTYAALDVALAHQVHRLIERLQNLGRVNPLVDARSMGELIFNNTNMMFTVFVKTGSMTVEHLRFNLRRQMRPIVGGLANAAG
jgi:AcrR family transcriptional regulator